MAAQRNHIKVFIASTVYNFQTELNSIYNMLDGFGYDVYSSHKGTFLTNSKLSNLKNCTNGVDDCDVFVGFIRPTYGSGIIEKGGKSITHYEFETALNCDIPRFVMTDHRVVFTKSLLRKAIVSEKKPGFFSKKSKINLNSSNVNFNDNNIMDIRCVQMYEEMIKDKMPPIKRKGNWVQEYTNLNDIRLYLESQFKYPDKIKKLIEILNQI